MADRRYGDPPPPTDSEIAHADWYAEDLSGCEHTRVAFSDVELTEAVGRAAQFTECTFRDCHFNSSRFEHSAFLNCTFTTCTFFDAAFVGCKLIGSMFDRCRFGAFSCEGGDWSFVGLPGADLRQCRFSEVRMREVDLVGARCVGAVLRSVDLSGAWLHNADLSGADLRGSEISSLDPGSVKLTGTIIDPDQTMVIAMALGMDVRGEEQP